MGTDAPIYHKPFGTVGLIVVNVWPSSSSPRQATRTGTLLLGEGLHPLQWVTNVFMHLDPGHLIGNMIFLWSFGIVVEGKLGAAAFLAAYLGIGVVQPRSSSSFLIPGAAGPHAGVIGGDLRPPGHVPGLGSVQRAQLLGLLPVHAVRVGRPDPLWFAVIYIGLEVLEVGTTGFSISSALAHAGGAAIGFAVAVPAASRPGSWTARTGTCSLCSRDDRGGPKGRLRGSRGSAGRLTRIP